MYLTEAYIRQRLQELRIPECFHEAIVAKWRKGNAEHADQDESQLDYREMLLPEDADRLCYTFMAEVAADMSEDEWRIVSMIQQQAAVVFTMAARLGWTSFHVGEPRRPIIYVAGPYNAPTWEEKQQNIKRAVEAMAALLEKGWAPIAPHAMYGGMEYEFDIPEEVFVDADLAFLDAAAAFLYLGSSKGADRELAIARARGIPIYYDVESVPERGEIHVGE